MSRWGSNATWLRQGACFSGRKGGKACSQVALGECHVAMGLQRDVAGAASPIFEQKRVQKRAPCRIGGERSLVGVPTRRVRDRKPGFRAEKGTKVGVTSHWRRAKSCWGSNATWQGLQACILSRKVVKSARHVVLAGSDVVLGVQRDVAEGTRPICHVKR